MFHFSYSKQSRAFNKLNWADWHSQETYMNLLNWYSHWLHTKTCIHWWLIIHITIIRITEVKWFDVQISALSLFLFRCIFICSSSVCLDDVLISCCFLIYSAILLMLNECKVHLTSKYVTLVTDRQCQPKFFLLVYLHKLK